MTRFAAGPLAQLHDVERALRLRPVRGPCRLATRTARRATPTRLDVPRERLAERRRVLLAQIDLEGRAVECKLDGLGGLAAIEIVGQLLNDFSGHNIARFLREVSAALSQVEQTHSPRQTTQLYPTRPQRKDPPRPHGRAVAPATGVGTPEQGREKPTPTHPDRRIRRDTDARRSPFGAPTIHVVTEVSGAFRTVPVDAPRSGRRICRARDGKQTIGTRATCASPSRRSGTHAGRVSLSEFWGIDVHRCLRADRRSWRVRNSTHTARTGAGALQRRQSEALGASPNIARPCDERSRGCPSTCCK